MTKDIYNLELHEILKITPPNVGAEVYAIRVPGGWLYSWGNDDVSPVFVPFNNEFEDKFKGAL